MATKQDRPLHDDQTGDYYAIRNVQALRQATNDNPPPGGPKVRRAANDNKRRSARTPAASTGPVRPGVGRATRAQSRLGSITPGQTRQVIAKGMNVAKALSATWLVIGTSWIFYAIQFVFALLYLLTMGGLMSYEGSWLETFDLFGLGGQAGAGMFLLCLGVIVAMWLCTFVTAIVIFLVRGISFGRGISVIIALVSLVASTFPVVNLLPWVWVWCAYVVKTQADD